MKSYDTLSEAVNDLIKRGYTFNFNIKPDCIRCVENEIDIHPEEFEIDEVYRFEGNTDPGDENILFAISSYKYDVKGLLVNAFGVYADSFSSSLMMKLNQHKTQKINSMNVYDALTIKEKLSTLKDWNYTDNALEKKFVFKDFKEALSFMVRVGLICETKNHHPEWTNVYNKLTIRFNTHDAGGVTDKDFMLAGEIDKITG
jgi:pterin-4a-carbinolamine dehydratase